MAQPRAERAGQPTAITPWGGAARAAPSLTPGRYKISAGQKARGDLQGVAHHSGGLHPISQWARTASNNSVVRLEPVTTPSFVDISPGALGSLPILTPPSTEISHTLIAGLSVP